MEKSFYIFILIIPVLLSGCSLLPTGGLNSGAVGRGVFKSADKGINWQEMNNLQDSTKKIDRLNVHKMNFDSTDSRIIYLGTDSGLYFSQDSAQSWQVIFLAVNVADFALNPKTRGIIYAVVDNQLHKTTDNGKNWSLIYTETKPGAVIQSIQISQFDTSRIYMLNSDGILMRSIDWGDSWKLFYDFKVRTKKLYIDPNNSLAMYVRADNGLYRTGDEGASWQEIIAGQNQYFPGSEIHKDIVFSEDSGDLYYLSQYGLLKSDNNGDSWQDIKLISPAGSVDIRAVALDPKNDDEIYYIVNNILYHTLDGGLNWKTKVLPNGKLRVSQILVDFYDANNLYIGLSQ
ncbi:MAG: hypothetical protein ABIJ91_02230 [Candidatus Kuenenbacteria bacterium]